MATNLKTNGGALKQAGEQARLGPARNPMTGQTRPGRDGLGNFCFCLHLVFLAFITLGWTLPSRAVLIVYLIFLPAVILHWKLNGDACVLNNLENWLRYRRWRAPEQNPEEGAWLRTLLRNLTGIMLTRPAMDAIIYAAMTLFWLLGLGHFQQFQGA
jgi:hypothetical protein